jgi:hypothetical protein
VADDELPAALAEIRHDFGLASHMTAIHIAHQGERVLAATEAALRHHHRTSLYGNAATDDEPGACPHDPDSPLHFEGDGEWLCEGKPEGAVCSACTEDGLPVAWPCPEYSAIAAALTGKGADGG